MRLDAKKLDFGSPLAPSWVPNGAQNRPSGAKSVRREEEGVQSVPFFLPTRFRGRFRNAPGHHFFGFLMDFDPIFKVFPNF